MKTSQNPSRRRDNLHYLRVCARAAASHFRRRPGLTPAEIYMQVFEEPASGPLFEVFGAAYQEEAAKLQAGSPRGAAS